MDEKNELIKSVEEFSVENADIVVNAIAKSEFLKAFPIFNELLAGREIVLNITNYLYARKIHAAINAIQNDDFKSNSYSDGLKLYAKNTDKFKSAIIFAIDKAQNEEKAEIIGHFIGLLMQKIISFDDFIFFTNIVNEMQLMHLKQFSQLYKNPKEIEEQTLYGVLQSQGLYIKYEKAPSVGTRAGSLAFVSRLTDQAIDFGRFLEQWL